MTKQTNLLIFKLKNYEKVSVFDVIANGYWFGIV